MSSSQNLSSASISYVIDFSSYHKISFQEALERIITEHRANTSLLRAFNDAYALALELIEKESEQYGQE